MNAFEEDDSPGRRRIRDCPDRPPASKNGKLR